jgi:hypothetical protein
MARSDEPAPRVGAVPLVLCALAVLLPIAAAPIPPSVDVPQHLAQIRLAREALRDPAGPYVIQWGAPNTLVYAPIALASWLLPPLAAGRALLALIALAWIAPALLLARARGRSPAVAMLATSLVFQHAFYWGFLNFLAGWPLFVAWVLLTPAELEQRSKRRDALRLAVAFGLYFAHVLWLGLALIWTVFAALFVRERAHALVRRCMPLVPALGLAVWWSLRIDAFRRASGFQMGTFWFDRFRLTPSWLVEATFGGVRGAAEPMMFAAIVGWLALAGYRAWRTGARLDRTFALAAALFAVLSIVVPDKTRNTLALPERLAPCAATFALLALPSPRGRLRWLDVVVGALLALFVASTTMAWRRWRTEDLDGLDSALAQLPEHARVVGFDFVRSSRFIRDEPFIQLFAYAQVLRDARLAFSFAQHGTGLVRMRSPERVWTVSAIPMHGTEIPLRALDGFDVALVDATDATHAALGASTHLRALTDRGRFRLYRVLP